MQKDAFGFFLFALTATWFASDLTEFQKYQNQENYQEQTEGNRFEIGKWAEYTAQWICSVALKVFNPSHLD